MKNRYPIKKVIKIEFSQSKYSCRGHGFKMYTLECGHILREKASTKEAS